MVGTWTGLILLLALLLGLALVIVGVCGRVVFAGPLCCRCRYDLRATSLDGGRCPECGWEICRDQIRYGVRSRRWRCLMGGVAVTFLAGGMVWRTYGDFVRFGAIYADLPIPLLRAITWCGGPSEAWEAWSWGILVRQDLTTRDQFLTWFDTATARAQQAAASGGTQATPEAGLLSEALAIYPYWLDSQHVPAARLVFPPPAIAPSLSILDTGWTGFVVAPSAPRSPAPALGRLAFRGIIQVPQLAISVEEVRCGGRILEIAPASNPTGQQFRIWPGSRESAVFRCLVRMNLPPGDDDLVFKLAMGLPESADGPQRTWVGANVCWTEEVRVPRSALKTQGAER